jgi:hypothetical protein
MSFLMNYICSNVLGFDIVQTSHPMVSSPETILEFPEGILLNYSGISIRHTDGFKSYPPRKFLLLAVVTSIQKDGSQPETSKS